MLIARPLVLGLVLLVLAGCGDAPANVSPPVEATTPAPGHVEKTVKARLAMTVSGAETLDLDTEANLHMVEIIGDARPRITWFLSVSPKLPIDLEDGRKLLFTADLSPGLYRGAGTYEMTPKGAVEVGGQTSPLGSAAYVMFLTLKPKPAEARYDELVEPCTLTVSENAVTGDVTCPTLGGHDGKTVSLRWSWELI